LRKSSRSCDFIGCASSSRSRNSAGSFDMAVSVLQKFSDRLLAVVQP
jgi:hypothetical protein